MSSEYPSGAKNNSDDGMKSKNGNKRSKKNCSDKRKSGGKEKLSRALAWALRHQGPNIGLSMTPDGYVPVSQIMSSKHPKLAAWVWTVQDIDEIVKTSDKQRFQLDQRPVDRYPGGIIVGEISNRNTVLCIRATQGHSLIFIDADLLLMPIPDEELAKIPTILHGTYHKVWKECISKGGLSRMHRNHIHCAPGFPQEKGGVMSGMRKTCNVYIYIDGAKCAANPDIRFYRSTNGVLLTAGVGGTGILPVHCFSHVTDPQGKIILDQRVGTTTITTTTTTVAD